MTRTRTDRTSRGVGRWGGVALVVVAVLGVGCGTDDEAADSTTTQPAAASTTSATSDVTTTTAPTQDDALCMAYLDFENAQDGAQRNTAIGALRAEITDATATAALDTLDAGDQDAAAVAAAAEALRAHVRSECAGAAVCQAHQQFEEAQDGAARNTALAELRTRLDDPAVTDDLDTLDAGDQDPADVTAAAEALTAYLDPLCGS